MFLGRSAQQHPLLPSVSRIRSLHMPGANLPAPVSKPRSCVSRACPQIPIEQLPLFFFKAKPATARALLFSCPSLRVCSDAPVHFFAQAAQYISLFSPLPPCVARLPAVQRDVSQKSRPIIPKNAEQSEKTRGLFLLTPQFPDFADTGAQRIPGCLPNYPMQGNIESRFYA